MSCFSGSSHLEETDEAKILVPLSFTSPYRENWKLKKEMGAGTEWKKEHHVRMLLFKLFS